MKYRKEEDNRYRVRFMRSTEELMDALTVTEFISYFRHWKAVSTTGALKQRF